MPELFQELPECFSGMPENISGELKLEINRLRIKKNKVSSLIIFYISVLKKLNSRWGYLIN